jgi:hypothetical protein
VTSDHAAPMRLRRAAALIPRAGPLPLPYPRRSSKLFRSPVACVYQRNNIRVVWSYLIDEPVFALSRAPGGRWLILAPCCRDLSGRTGVRRIAVFDEPVAGGSRPKVIKKVAKVAG